MLKCKVCGKEFEAVKENHYVAREGLKSGAFVDLASTEEKTFDAFDCPYCGCQYVAGERKRNLEAYGCCVCDNEEQNKEREYEEIPSCFAGYKDNYYGCIHCYYSADCKEAKEVKEKCVICDECEKEKYKKAIKPKKPKEVNEDEK